MKNWFSAFLVMAVSNSAFATLICTITPFGDGIGLIDINEKTFQADLSDPNSLTNNFILKKDGSLLKNVHFNDFTSKPKFDKVGDVDGAVSISLSKGATATEGVYISIASLSNSQSNYKREIEVSTPVDTIAVSFIQKKLALQCQKIVD